VAHAREVAGSVEIAVLSAGIGHWTPVAAMSEEQWRDTMAVNLDAVYYATRALLPAMLEEGRGHLVFVSSVLGRKGVPNMAAYSASKAAVAAFAESVAAEVKPHGVKVTVMYPGTTATGMRDHQVERPRTPDITDPDLQLAPEDVADAIAWATDTSARAYPTGVTIEPRGLAGRADGGSRG
jgi:NAD(P)-dependent dehydrogenase (short-subunit alcohol dehydrogenase family)